MPTDQFGKMISAIAPAAVAPAVAASEVPEGTPAEEAAESPVQQVMEESEGITAEHHKAHHEHHEAKSKTHEGQAALHDSHAARHREHASHHAKMAQHHKSNMGDKHGA